MPHPERGLRSCHRRDGRSRSASGTAELKMPNRRSLLISGAAAACSSDLQPVDRIRPWRCWLAQTPAKDPPEGCEPRHLDGSRQGSLPCRSAAALWGGNWNTKATSKGSGVISPARIANAGQHSFGGLA
ncbi:MAG: hypothetical protein CM15mP77_1550 [Synechococcus sp.]|nr:MAG: hypothetical protein CM15mP77_1550 [Synechococcus sp.]